MEQKTKQKMSTKKKASAVVAGALVAALALGGAYAWTDYSQNARNTFKGAVAADVLLHDDFNGENKDVYVENTGDSEVFVRVKFAEYLQVGNNSVLAAYSEEGTTTEKADRDDVTTWPVHQFKNVADATDNDCGLSTHNYFEWEMSGKQKDYLAGVTESNSNGYGGLTEAQFNALNPGADVTLGDITTQKQSTLDGTPVMMLTDWLTAVEAGEEPDACWLLDTDGWAYWSKALGAGQATNLLLDSVVATDAAPSDNWLYHIDVQLQAATITEMEAWFRDGFKEVANPDNSIATATMTALEFIKNRAGDNLTATDGTIIGLDGKYYISVANNVYSEAVENATGTGYEANGVFSLAGQDGVIGNDDDNLLAGRIATASTLADEDNNIKVRDINVEKMTYKIEGATDDYVVTAGIDKKLGTYDDVITSTSGALGKYDIDGEGELDFVGWNYLGGSLDNMLVATEYVLDNVTFNTSTATGNSYDGSNLEDKITQMGNAFISSGMKNVVENIDLDMSAAQHTGNAVYVCTKHEQDDTHNSGCNSVASTYYTNNPDQGTIPGTTFFALSLKEVLDAYGDSIDKAILQLRIVQGAPAYLHEESGGGGDGKNRNNDTTWKDGDGNYIRVTNYWLRSSGYSASRAVILDNTGLADARTSVSATTIGARPACYLNLKSTN